MCYAKPGPRCTTHSRAAMKKAKKELETLENDSQTSSDKLTQAQRNYDMKRWEFLTSPGGMKEILAKAKEASQAGDQETSKKFTETYVKALREHNAQMIAYKQKNGIELTAIEKVSVQAAEIGRQAEIDIANMKREIQAEQATRAPSPVLTKRTNAPRNNVTTPTITKSEPTFRTDDFHAWKRKIAQNGSQDFTADFSMVFSAGVGAASVVRNQFREIALRYPREFSYTEVKTGLISRGMRIEWYGSSKKASMLIDYLDHLYKVTRNDKDDD